MMKSSIALICMIVALVGHAVGQTPDIWTAASQGNLEVIRKHLAAGTDINATLALPGVPGSGGAPLHVAVMAGKIDAVKLLLEGGATVDVKADDEHKGTPLQWAAFFGRPEFVKLLLAKGADVNAADRNGYTPLDAARHQADWMPDKTAVVAFLREKGGKPRGDAPAGDGSASQGRRAMSSKLHVNDAVPKREGPAAGHEVVHPAWSRNWPQFRGPGLLGVSTNNGLPDTWSATEHVAWKTSIPGRGWSSPVVWGNQIFITTAIKEGELEAAKEGLYRGGNRPAPKESHRWIVYCLDLDSDEIAWEKDVHRGVAKYGHHVKGSMASETAVCDAERVYAYIGNVGMFCFDHDGKALWEKRWESVPTRFGWGTAASPVLHGDRVYVVNDNEQQSFLVALDRKSGEWIWRADRDEKSNWATPFVWENGERTEIVTPGTGKIRSYGLDGKLLWELGGMSSITIPTPFAGHGLLYVTSGYVGDKRRPLFAIRPGAKGDISLGADETRNAHIAWCQKQAGPYNVSPILYGDYLYVLHDRGFLACYDAKTGKEVYGKRRVAPGARAFTSSPWAYDGKIFCLSEKGDTYVVRAGPAFELLGKNSLGELCMATPAIVPDGLIIRTESHILRIR